MSIDATTARTFGLNVCTACAGHVSEEHDNI